MTRSSRIGLILVAGLAAVALSVALNSRGAIALLVFALLGTIILGHVVALRVHPHGLLAQWTSPTTLLGAKLSTNEKLWLACFAAMAAGAVFALAATLVLGM